MTDMSFDMGIITLFIVIYANHFGTILNTIKITNLNAFNATIFTNRILVFMNEVNDENN